MKVNKMIGKAMAATVAVTMMLGGATVMADCGSQPDLRAPIMPDYGNWDQRDRRMIPMRPDNLDDLHLPYLEEIRRAQEEAQAREAVAQKPDEETPEIEITEGQDDDPGTIVVIEEPDEPEAELTLEILGLDEEDEEADDALFHTGDILRITNEPTTLPAGVYRIYYTERDFSTFTCASFYMHNGRMIMQRGGISISIGPEYRALRIKVLDNGTVELHPMTPAEIAMYDEFNSPAQEPEVPEIPETPETPEIPYIPDAPVAPNTATPIDCSEPAIPAPVATISEIPAPAAETPAAPSAPAAVSAPVTQVAGAARLVAEGGVEGFVNRLYTVALGREADPTGYAYWVEMLNSKQMTATEVANGFFGSAEFAARDLNNVEYLTVLYNTFFDREPDHNGLNHWVSSIQNGLLTREQVIEGFTGSAEWANTCGEFGVEA